MGRGKAGREGGRWLSVYVLTFLMLML
jgi:hypothetical protein